MGQQNTTKSLPIGYWLKHTDEVITRHVNQVLGNNGFTRFRWQVLNSIYENGIISRKEIFQTMQTFISKDHFDEIVQGFVKEGWLVEQGEGDTQEFELTGEGKAQREILFKLQSEVRKQALQGIAEKEYMFVIEVLQRMVHNLEAGQEQPCDPTLNCSGGSN